MTSRTNSPSEAALGTARLPNPSTTLSREVEIMASHARDTAALIRKMDEIANHCGTIQTNEGTARTLDGCAHLLTRISAERDRLEKTREEIEFHMHAADELAEAYKARAERAEAEARRSRYAELAWEKHCKEAEAERDELASAKAEIAEAASILMQERDKAEADLSALKARVAESMVMVESTAEWLSDFARMTANEDHVLSTAYADRAAYLRRAADLHATLSGEQK